MKNLHTKRKRREGKRMIRGLFLILSLVGICSANILVQDKSSYICMAGVNDIVQTDIVDNDAEGIKLNLFDYTVDNDETVVSNDASNPTYRGINGTTTNKKDLLFFRSGPGGTYTDDRKINLFTDTSVNAGIVNSALGSDGYPVLTTTNKQSLSYLFNPDTTVEGKKTYKDVNKLFQLKDGYYQYDSNVNYAKLNSNKDFTLYKYPSETSTKIGFFPFNDFDATKTDVSEGKYNHHFGLSMEINFLLAEDKVYNGKDMIFEFSGDDDVWVFLDNVLVLDIGGIHRAIGGNINFKTGKVTVNGVTKNLTDIYKYNGADWSSHTLKFFYLERGGKESNNKIKFNLPTRLQISKKIESTSGADTTDFDNKDYTFKLLVKKSANDSYSPYTDSAYYADGRKVSFDSTNKTFKMRGNDTVNIQPNGVYQYYKVEEQGISNSIFSKVKIAGKDTQELTVNGESFTAQSKEYKFTECQKLEFTNVLKEECKDIIIKKEWYDANNQPKTEDIPDSINVVLNRKCNGEKDDTWQPKNIVLKGDSWQQTIKGLITVLGNKSYTYYVDEANVPTGYTKQILDPVCTETAITFTIKNTMGGFGINVVKHWLNPSGTDKTEGLPEAITVVIKRGIKDSKGKIVDSSWSRTVAINKAGDGTWSFSSGNKDLATHDKNGNVYYYYVKELSFEKSQDYTVSYDNNNGISFQSACNTISISNTCKYIENITFPETGGSGTTAFIMSGFAIILCSLIYMWSVVRKGRCKKVL